LYNELWQLTIINLPAINYHIRHRQLYLSLFCCQPVEFNFQGCKYFLLQFRFDNILPAVTKPELYEGMVKECLGIQEPQVKTMLINSGYKITVFNIGSRRQIFFHYYIFSNLLNNVKVFALGGIY
jgi:hypothetical protein